MMSQANETTPKRGQRNYQPRTTATTSAAPAVPPPSGPQARSPATRKRGPRAATGGPREKQMTCMLEKFRKCLALSQTKMLEQMRSRKSTSPPPTPTPPPPPPVAAPLQLQLSQQQSAAVQLSAPPHIRAMSGNEYAAATSMRSATVHNPLLVSRALETVFNQQGPSTTTTPNRGAATDKSSSGGKKKRGVCEEENVIVLDNEDELQAGSSTEAAATKKRRVMKNKSVACTDDAVATELPLQMIIPTSTSSSHEEEKEEEEKTTTTVEGFIYHDEKEKEGCIISCNCHGMIFLTPADFIKHAGGTTHAFSPIKRISIAITHLS